MQGIFFFSYCDTMDTGAFFPHTNAGAFLLFPLLASHFSAGLLYSLFCCGMPKPLAPQLLYTFQLGAE